MLFHLWKALWHTQSALILQTPEAMPGALSTSMSYLEDNQSNRPDGKERIGNIVAPMEMEELELTANMVRVILSHEGIKL